jgi:hypothetical protein
MVLSGLGAVAAQSTLHADINRKREYYTLGDSVSYDESLRWYYSWSVKMRGETGTPVALEVLTQQPVRTGREPTREDSAYRYRWDLLDVTNDSGRVYFVSDLETTFQPGFNSQRTVSTSVLDHQVTVQTLQVKVTPRESSFSSLHVTAEYGGWWETSEVRATMVPDSDRGEGRFEVDSSPSGPAVSWDVQSPVNGKEYEFSVQFSIENKLYPSNVVYKPYVWIDLLESSVEERLTGSTVTVEDDILGEIRFSAPSASRWQFGQTLERGVRYEGESAVWGSVGDYAICKSIDQDDNPVERSSDFLTIDDRVTVWVNLYDLRVSVDVKFEWYAPALEWYAPDGILYREQSVTTSSPPEGEVRRWREREAWNYPVHDSIEVKGKPPSRMLGDWNVKVYVDGAEPIVAGFRIRRAPSSISVSFSVQTVSQGENSLVTGGLLEAHEGDEIVLDYVRPDGSIVKRAVATEPDGSFSDRYSPDTLGAWAVTASWEGNEDYEGASMTRGFTVTTTTRPAEEALAAWPPTDLLLVAGIIIVIAAVGAVALLYRKKRSSLPPR